MVQGCKKMSDVGQGRTINEKQAGEDFLLEKTASESAADHHRKTSPMYSLLGNQDVVLIPIDDHKEIDEAELHGFRRTVAEIQWLLLVLVILCMKLPGMTIEKPMNLVTSMGIFAAYVFFVHYIWRSQDEKRWKLALNTWAMVFFITAVVWQTGGLSSPLLPLYFLVVILSATTLGMVTTLLETSLITVCYLLLAASGSGDLRQGFVSFTLAELPGPVIQLFLLWFIAYFVSLISWESEKAKEKIRQLSRTDQLTGLWNMKMLLIFMQREHKRSLRENLEFSVLMIDADNLKGVNDTYGHDAGTRMIIHIAESMRSQLREADMLARFGGDEFVALLPETDSQGALLLAESMRKKIAETRVDYEGKELGITVSIGIACFPRHGRELAYIMKMADKALYTSKHLGKNRTSLFQDDNASGQLLDTVTPS
ncbi:MAG: GGDEF domain-containing protein [Desulfobulbus sp.]|nr:MAG: GGDEF domain-containing protein [Desulfobulbus sp.]